MDLRNYYWPDIYRDGVFWCFGSIRFSGPNFCTWRGSRWRGRSIHFRIADCCPWILSQQRNSSSRHQTRKYPHWSSYAREALWFWLRKIWKYWSTEVSTGNSCIYVPLNPWRRRLQRYIIWHFCTWSGSYWNRQRCSTIWICHPLGSLLQPTCIH